MGNFYWYVTFNLFVVLFNMLIKCLIFSTMGSLSTINVMMKLKMSSMASWSRSTEKMKKKARVRATRLVVNLFSFSLNILRARVVGHKQF